MNVLLNHIQVAIVVQLVIIVRLVFLLVEADVLDVFHVGELALVKVLIVRIILIIFFDNSLLVFLRCGLLFWRFLLALDGRGDFLFILLTGFI